LIEGLAELAELFEAFEGFDLEPGVSGLEVAAGVADGLDGSLEWLSADLPHVELPDPASIGGGDGWQLDSVGPEGVQLGEMTGNESGWSDELVGMHGDPAGAASTFHHQAYDDTCAIAAQMDVAHSISGVALDEETLRLIADANDWYTPGGGTPMNCVGNVLEACGVPVERLDGVELDTLASWLDEGRGVIVGVDALELWNPASQQDWALSEWLSYPEAGHAVRVTGIGADPFTGERLVYMNDPGQPNGAGFSVPLEDFVDAWEDTGRFACVTA